MADCSPADDSTTAPLPAEAESGARTTVRVKAKAEAAAKQAGWATATPRQLAIFSGRSTSVAQYRTPVLAWFKAASNSYTSAQHHEFHQRPPRLEQDQLCSSQPLLTPPATAAAPAVSVSPPGQPLSTAPATGWEHVQADIDRESKRCGLAIWRGRWICVVVPLCEPSLHCSGSVLPAPKRSKHRHTACRSSTGSCNSAAVQPEDRFWSDFLARAKGDSMLRTCNVAVSRLADVVCAARQLKGQGNAAARQGERSAPTLRSYFEAAVKRVQRVHSSIEGSDRGAVVVSVYCFSNVSVRVGMALQRTLHSTLHRHECNGGDSTAAAAIGPERSQSQQALCGPLAFVSHHQSDAIQRIASTLPPKQVGWRE